MPPPIERGEHKRLYRFSADDYREIAARLRSSAGLPDQPTGRVANEPGGLVDKVKDKLR